ncbi:FadR/GntR family transcriptional regulator [Pseudochelatococcus sp. B33]
MSKRDSNTETLMARLREAVTNGDEALVRGGQLPTERQLMAMFGLARRSVRSALDVLQSEGLIYRRQGQGTFIWPTNANASRVSNLSNQTSPAEIMEVRREIEPTLARLSAMRATPSDIDQMRRLAERGGEAKTSLDYERWDSALHSKIAESIRNGLFQGLFQLIQAVRVEQKWTGLRAQTFKESLRDELVAQHLVIVDAIAERDPEAADRAMRDHLEAVSRIIGT